MIADLRYLAESHDLPYWKRAELAKNLGLMLNVYVPKLGRLMTVARGSAIVGFKIPHTPFVRVHFEGNVYGTISTTFEAMLHHAADRMATGYPTVACGMYELDELIQVGMYDYAKDELTITDQVELDAWRA